MEKDKLTANQLRAVRCILQSNSLEEASRTAKVSRTSIYNWLKDENFREKLNKERNTLFCESLDLLKQATGKAVKELIDLLRSRNEKTRRLAAKEIINFSLRMTELRDLGERLNKLEEVIERERHRRWA